MTDYRYKSFVELIRPYNAMAPVLAFCIGYFFRTYGHADRTGFALGILSILLVHAIATIRNDINDREIDRVNSPHKPLASNRLSVQAARNFAVVLAMILLCVALIQFPIGAAFIGCMMVLVILYNERPFFFSRRPFLSIIVLALMYSTLPFLYGYCLTHPALGTDAIVTVISWLILRSSIVMLKDFKDAEGDSLFHKKTFYLAFGKQATIVTSLALGTVGMTGILCAATIAQRSWWLILALILGLYGLYLRYTLLKADGRNDLTSIFHKIFFEQNQFDLAYLLWIFLR